MAKGARWVGESYRRKRSNTWRNARTGKISSTPNPGSVRGNRISIEKTKEHISGLDIQELGSPLVTIRRRSIGKARRKYGR